MDLDVHVELAAEKLFSIGPLEVTNSMLTMWVIMALIILVFWLAARKGSLVPGKFQSVIEMIVEFVSNLVYSTAGKRLGRRIMPLILGLFVFIWIANLSGLLPGVGTIGYYEEEETAEVVAVEGDEAADADHSDEATTSEETDTTVAATTEEHAEDEHAEEAHSVLVPFIRPPNGFRKSVRAPICRSVRRSMR